MNSTIKLLQILGSPFTQPLSELALSDGEVKELYDLAFRNKVGLFFLETLKRRGMDLGELQAEYDKGYFRYKETLVTAANISRVLDNAGVDHVIFKFFKPYPFTPSDVDVLFMCSDTRFRQAYKILFNDGYYRLGAAPHQVIAYDLRGGVENMDRSMWGGKKGGIYYIDLYDEIAASHVIYMDKTKLKEFTFETDIVNALVTGAESSLKNEIMNVGSGSTYSVNRLVELLGGEVVHIPKRPGEPDRSLADITKIKKLLGWKPKVSFEEGVKVLLDNIGYWKDAPLWTPDSISEATRDWFKYLAP